MQPIHHFRHRQFDKITDYSDFIYHWISSITQVFKTSRFVFQAVRKLNRFRLVHFRREYVQHQLLVRKGDCRQCGTCCSLLFTCPMLTKQGRCFVYGFCRPQACKVFPIDQQDIDEIKLCGSQCGYRFENGSSKNHTKEKGN